MTTSEPPENRPTPPAGSDHTSSETPASDHPAPEHAMASESPTEQIDPSGAGHRTGDPADPATDPAAGHRADPVADPAGGQPAEHGAATPAAAGAGVGAFAARPRSTRAAGTSRWNPRGWSPRRRWLGIGVLVILVLLVVGLILGLSRHHRWGHRHGHGHHGGPGHSAYQQGMPGMGWGGMGGMGGGFGPTDGPGGGRMGGPGGGADREGGPMANTATLTGSVVSVAPGNLVVAQDGAGQVTVPTTDRTRMMGVGNGLTGLQPGQRVVVRIGGDKSAVAVFSPKAQAVGTITAVAGDRATLVRPDGLTEPVDLSAVNPKPANGDVVAVSGTATENGATLKVEALRPMPKAG